MDARCILYRVFNVWQLPEDVRPPPYSGDEVPDGSEGYIIDGALFILNKQIHKLEIRMETFDNSPQVVRVSYWLVPVAKE